MTNYLSELCQRAFSFREQMEIKRLDMAPKEFWYPYGSMNNFGIFEQLLTGQNRTLLRDLEPKRAADIGAADGDLSFFLESEGWIMTIIDNPPTNWNGLKGAKLFKEQTKSSVRIVETDLDSQFTVDGSYDVVFALGLLYHLKNPFYFLERLSYATRYCFLSTRVAQWTGPTGPSTGATGDQIKIQDFPLAYLLGPAECNNDSTNYWIFSETGLRRLIERTGWKILDHLLVGELERADPMTSTNDGRSFCLLQSERTARA